MHYLTAFILALLITANAWAVEVGTRVEPTYAFPPLVVRDYSNWPYYVGIALVVALLFFVATKLQKAKVKEEDKALRDMVSKDYEEGPIF